MQKEIFKSPSNSSLTTLTRQGLKSAIIGMILGDGHLGQQRRRDGVYRGKAYIDLGHSLRQSEYLAFKLKLLQPLFQYPLTMIHRFARCGMNEKIYPKVTLRSRVHPRLTQIHSLMYRKSPEFPRGKKIVTREILDKLTPLALAIWYMDDGSLSKIKKNGLIHYQVALHTQSFSYEENLIIKRWFKEKLKIDFNLTRNRGGSGYHLRKGLSQAYRLLELVRPFIVDCLKYKVDYHFGLRDKYDLTNSGKMTNKICVCGIPFQSPDSRPKKFHSRECYQQSRVTAPDTLRG